jgi:hypothetical protein
MALVLCERPQAPILLGHLPVDEQDAATVRQLAKHVPVTRIERSIHEQPLFGPGLAAGHCPSYSAAR